MNEHKRKRVRSVAEEAFLESLDHLHKLPKTQEEEDLASEENLFDELDVADWDDAAADLEDFFKNLSDSNNE
jgi:hypothetical protein